MSANGISNCRSSRTLIVGTGKGVYKSTDRGEKWKKANKGVSVRNIKMLAKTETLSESLDSYRQKIAGKKRNQSAPYELAIKSGRNYQAGDQISYYVTGSKKRVTVYDNCKLAYEWDRNDPDENVEYYCQKLSDLYKKFTPFVETQQDSLF